MTGCGTVYIWNLTFYLFYILLKVLMLMGAADAGIYAVREQCQWWGENQDIAKDKNSYLVETASSLVGLCHKRKNILMVPTHAQFRPYSIKDLSSSKLLVPCFPSLAMTSCILRFSLKYPAIEHVRCQEGLRDQDAN
jgi:hypothetical protein